MAEHHVESGNLYWVFSEIRNLFAKMPEAMIRGYKPGRFSFNVKGAAARNLSRRVSESHRMNFLPDVYVECESCQGITFTIEKP